MVPIELLKINDKELILQRSQKTSIAECTFAFYRTLQETQ